MKIASAHALSTSGTMRKVNGGGHMGMNSGSLMPKVNYVQHTFVLRGWEKERRSDSPRVSHAFIPTQLFLAGLMARRDASINDVRIKESERRYFRNKDGVVEFPFGHP